MGDTPPPRYPVSRMKIPQSFQSAVEAKNCLDFYFHADICGAEISGQHNELGNDIGQPEDSLVRLHQWSMAFDAFIEVQGETLSRNERNIALVLKIQRLLYSAILDMPSNDQTLWDKHNVAFEKMISLAEEIFDMKGQEVSISPVKSLETSFLNPTATPTFTLDVGIVAPLYDIACRCRDPMIRRRALHVLRMSSRHEAIYNGVLAAQIVQKVIASEEAGFIVTSSSDVPSSARISHVSRQFDAQQRKASLCYYRWEESSASPVFTSVDF